MVKKLKSKAVVIKEESDNESSASEAKPPIKGAKPKTMTFSASLPDDIGSDSQPEDMGSNEDFDDYDEEDQGGSQDDGSDDQELSDDKDDGSLLSGEDCVEVPQEEEVLTAGDLEKKRKQKRLEKLEKAIKKLQKEKGKKGPKNGKFEKEASEIKNKHKRQEVVLRRRMQAHAEKKLEKL